MKPAILIVDDEAGVRSSLAGVLSDEGYVVETVDSGEACLQRTGGRVFDLIILDIWLPGVDGLETLTTLRERGVDAQVVMISGHGSIEAAVRAIKQGAFEFIEKSLSLDKTVLVVRNALRQRRLEVENQALRADADRRQIMVGDSPVMAELRAQVALAAPTNGRVLIQGENGTGKELVARSLHALSRRSVGPFVDVNCAAIPEELIESELFGHVRGAFTGAMHDRPGKFELADEGTIFLDEVADMSLKTQAKVLRVLQEQVVERVGGRAGVGVDVRVVAATNKSLPEEIRAGRFRDDLFYRLNVVSITVPPLRDRRDDVVPLSEHFLTIYAGEYGHGLKRIDSDALRILRHYDWPGNVRELRNVIERVVIMVSGPVISARDVSFLTTSVPPAPAAAGHTTAAVRLHEARDRFERDYILSALEAQHGNISRAADALGLERSNLYRKMRAFGIRPSRPSGIRRGASTGGADGPVPDPS